MVTVALVIPLDVDAVPSEQTFLLPAATDNFTANPEVESAATVKVLLSGALDGAAVVNVIVWPMGEPVVDWVRSALR
jgi:hypothetical protein